MIPFSEPLRYDYPLNPQSVCIDVGAYEGNWSRHIHQKTGARIDAYEPVRRFYDKARANLATLDMVRIYHAGVAATTKHVDIHVQNDSSGAFAGSADVEKCYMIGIEEVLRIASVPEIAVLKLNCEGMEYEILEHLLTHSDGFGPCIKRLRNIQVQFHMVVPDWENRYGAIAADLAQTHECTWREPFVWENWTLRK